MGQFPPRTLNPQGKVVSGVRGFKRQT